MDGLAPRIDAPAAHAAQWHERRRPAVRIRRVREHDAPLIGEFIRGLSPASRQRRFHSAIRDLPPQWLERMVRPDPAHELALVAVVSSAGRDVCVAEARYVASDDVLDGREFALAVADGWQGRGIGKTLLLSLGAHAARHGVPRLVGDVLRDNLPMIELARGLGYAVHGHPGDRRLVRAWRAFACALPGCRAPGLGGDGFI
jgi:acetyltransferase